MDSQDKIKKVFDSVRAIVLEKNRRYGDSALSPLSIFGKHINSEPDQSTKSILVRLDDKLNRVKNSDCLRRNDVIDIIGYLGILAVDKDWVDNDDLID